MRRACLITVGAEDLGTLPPENRRSSLWRIWDEALLAAPRQTDKIVSMELPNPNTIKRLLDRYAPVHLSVNARQLAPRDRQSLVKLVETGRGLIEYIGISAHRRDGRLKRGFSAGRMKREESLSGSLT
jgi:hypothetical protein